MTVLSTWFKFFFFFLMADGEVNESTGQLEKRKKRKKRKRTASDATASETTQAKAKKVWEVRLLLTEGDWLAIILLVSPNGLTKGGFWYSVLEVSPTGMLVNCLAWSCLI